MMIIWIFYFNKFWWHDLLITLVITEYFCFKKKRNNNNDNNSFKKKYISMLAECFWLILMWCISGFCDVGLYETLDGDKTVCEWFLIKVKRMYIHIIVFFSFPSDEKPKVPHNPTFFFLFIFPCRFAIFPHFYISFLLFTFCIFRPFFVHVQSAS